MKQKSFKISLSFWGILHQQTFLQQQFKRWQNKLACLSQK
jgi:hypothetical protein